MNTEDEATTWLKDMVDSETYYPESRQSRAWAIINELKAKYANLTEEGWSEEDQDHFEYAYEATQADCSGY
jgi:hypothetical protein